MSLDFRSLVSRCTVSELQAATFRANGQRHELATPDGVIVFYSWDRHLLVDEIRPPVTVLTKDAGRDHASRLRFVGTLAIVGELSRRHLLEKEPDEELPQIYHLAVDHGHTNVATTTELLMNERGLS